MKRRPSPTARQESERALQRFVRLEHWNGLSAGDVVRVSGNSPRGRHWRFRAHVTNTSNGASWVELALVEGSAPSRRPPPGAVIGEEASRRVERVRSFEPDLVSPRFGLLGRRSPRRHAGPRRPRDSTPESLEPPVDVALAQQSEATLF
ncbi:MAG: hypothetical protein ACRDZ6_11575 [Acidimicrobiales bacterium]